MTPLIRTADWPERLAEFLEARRHAPLQWGRLDCCLLAADWVHACTGVDLAAAHRGTYHTAAEAVRLLTRLGGVAAIADAALPAQAPALARRGDLVLVEGQDARPALAIVSGTGMAAGPGPDGLIFVPVASATRGWSVG